MWSRFLICLSLVLVSAAPLAADMEESAWQARDLLGPDRWAQVLSIEHSRRFAQPATVYALVFELEGRLWFYADNRGTESLSTHRDRLEEDKADLGPLLQNIDPGFTRFKILREPARFSDHVPGRRGLPNGCFIESVAYLRLLVELGQAPDEARLLAFYGINGAGRGGHTVLYYERHGQRFYYDPAGSPDPRPIPERVRSDALAVARVAATAVAPYRPERAFFFPMRVPPASRLEWSDSGALASHMAVREPAASAIVN